MQRKIASRACPKLVKRKFKAVKRTATGNLRFSTVEVSKGEKDGINLPLSKKVEEKHGDPSWKVERVSFQKGSPTEGEARKGQRGHKYDWDTTFG